MQKFPVLTALYPELFNCSHTLRTKKIETCICLFIKEKMITSDHIFSSNDRNQLIINPRNFITQLIHYQASEIIIMHNHPSETCYPSQADIHSTEKIVQLGSLLAFDVLDHIIITSNEYFSFQEAGML